MMKNVIKGEVGMWALVEWGWVHRPDESTWQEGIG